jgi:hypothetical protein
LISSAAAAARGLPAIAPLSSSFKRHGFLILRQNQVHRTNAKAMTEASVLDAQLESLRETVSVRGIRSLTLRVMCRAASVTRAVCHAGAL